MCSFGSPRAKHELQSYKLIHSHELGLGLRRRRGNGGREAWFQRTGLVLHHWVAKRRRDRGRTHELSSPQGPKQSQSLVHFGEKKSQF